MQVSRIQNYNNKPSFGTVMGVALAEKLTIAQERGMLRPEHTANIERIKNDGKFLILDFVDKYKIVSKGNEKGVFKKFLYLTLMDINGKEVALKDASDLLSPFSKDKNIFHLSKFLKLFSDDYRLADDIIENSKKLE